MTRNAVDQRSPPPAAASAALCAALLALSGTTAVSDNGQKVSRNTFPDTAAQWGGTVLHQDKNTAEHAAKMAATATGGPHLGVWTPDYLPEEGYCTHDRVARRLPPPFEPAPLFKRELGVL